MHIDSDMHIGKFSGDPYVWLGHPIGPAELEAIMDEYQLAMTMVMAPTAQYPDNESLAIAIAGHKRLIGFAVVNPYGPGDGVPELRRAVMEWGMRGLKLMPLRHGYEADGRTARKIMECAAELRVPVSIHSGAQFCLPWQIASLARLFPTVPVIMDHMGYRYYVDGAIEVAQEVPNIYLQTALVSMPGYIRMAVDKAGADRVIYGSGYPSGHPASMIATIKAAKLSPAQEALVMGGNLARLMNLEKETKKQTATNNR
ncbi:MAG: amidohydrolase [Betaproteobacteria bacterium]|nr:amidohydrolase [Betaproteobacteria bacterium]